MTSAPAATNCSPTDARPCAPVADGVSVLDAMAASVLERKAKAAGPKPTLTPLPGEAQGVSILASKPAIPSAPVAFPYDQPGPELLRLIADLERQHQALGQVIHALRVAAGDPAAVAKEIEKGKETTAANLAKEVERRVADRERVAEGDPKDPRVAASAKAIEAERPIEDVVEAAEARDAKRAAVLAAMVEAAGGPDEGFDARMARLQAEAHEATFTRPTAEPASPGQWTCPTHGQRTTKISARRKVEFGACPVTGCTEFERV